MLDLTKAIIGIRCEMNSILVEMGCGYVTRCSYSINADPLRCCKQLKSRSTHGALVTVVRQLPAYLHDYRNYMRMI